MKILLITPPLLQPNTPYAATPLLSAWLGTLGHQTDQRDFSLELLLRLFSRDGLNALFSQMDACPPDSQHYLDTIETVISFLQDRNPQAAQSISTRGYLPEGPALQHAYAQEEQLEWGFRGVDLHDRAKHLASLYLDDLSSMAEEIDSAFGFSRYAERLAESLPGFSPVAEFLEQQPSLFREWLDELTQEALVQHKPEMVALTVPFPGCLIGALAVARCIKKNAPEVHITMGGGYVNTELRGLTDPRVFNEVDTITLDSGFLPLQRLIHSESPADWVRTFCRENGQVVYHNADADPIPHNQLPAPDYAGLRMDDYFGLFEALNPVTRLWSDGRWNKLTLAHGCCWSRCAFCDTSIEYISHYDPASAETICNWILTVMAQTGFNGFHFVDESLPPDLLDALCDVLLRRGIQIEWWGNIRFEKRLKPQLIEKMAAAGCIAVTGGLETCHDRTLKLMQKGIVVKHAERVLRNLAHAGIMTHAYLMYGFPTQTEEETLEALETVRRMFDENILHSAFWHRFALTAHSPIYEHPDQFNIRIGTVTPSTFGLNEVPFDGEYDHNLERMGQLLGAATYNYQLGIGIDLPVQNWAEITKEI